MLFETLSWKSLAVLIGSSLAASGATYFVYSRAKKQFDESENKRETLQEKEDSIQNESSSSPSSFIPASRPKKVLVLGLKGSGKSSLVESLTLGAVGSPPEPTSGFSVVQCRIPARVEEVEIDAVSENDAETSFTPVYNASPPPTSLEVDLWEIGGDDAFRKFWSHFYSQTDCLLFLLDPGAGAAVVGEAAEELARAAGDYRMGAVPLIVVATHQDRRQSQMETKDLRRLLVDVGISPQILRRICRVATPASTRAPDNEDDEASSLKESEACTASGIDELKKLLAKILS